MLLLCRQPRPEPCNCLRYCEVAAYMSVQHVDTHFAADGKVRSKTDINTACCKPCSYVQHDSYVQLLCSMQLTSSRITTPGAKYTQTIVAQMRLLGGSTKNQLIVLHIASSPCQDTRSCKPHTRLSAHCKLRLMTTNKSTCIQTPWLSCCCCNQVLLSFVVHNTASFVIYSKHAVIREKSQRTAGVSNKLYSA